MLKQKYNMPVSDILGGSVRHVLCASKDKTFVVADLSSIESVVLGWVTGCELINDTFVSGKDSYKVFASKYYDIEYDNVTKEQRGFSKPPVLGCFAEDTEVLTDSGWKRITHVSKFDKVFDGTEFVSHEGVIDQGMKECITKYGVKATPDHKFLIEEGTWCQFKDLTDKKAVRATNLVSGRYLSIWGRVIGCLLNKSSKTSGTVEARTYDILNCGPRSRFVIKTSKGPMIVHNCGYMLGWKGLIAYAEGYGVELEEDDARNAVNTFRSMYPEIPEFWNNIYKAVTYVCKSGRSVDGYRMRIERDDEFLRIRLPSGRNLSYHRPEMRMMPAPWDKNQLIENFTYMGMDKKNQWVRISAHAGLVTENVVQSIAGDILWRGITNAESEGLHVVAHVHDEIVAEVLESEADVCLNKLIECMTRKEEWYDGMWLGADGFITKRFTKD